MIFQNLLVLDLTDFIVRLNRNAAEKKEKADVEPGSDYGSDLDDFDLNLDNYGEENFDFELDAAVDDFGYE